VVQIVLGTMTTKKTREWLHGLAPATGVPTIQPSLNDFHRIPDMESFACIKAGSEVYIFPVDQVGAKHVADPGLQMAGKIETKSALHILFINKFLEPFTLHNEITPRDNRAIFIHGEQFCINYGTSLTPVFRVRKSIVCIFQVECNRQ